MDGDVTIRRKSVCAFLLMGLAIVGLQRSEAVEDRSIKQSPGVRVAVNEGARRVDVTVDEKPFTAYIWPDSVKKPVLYPIRTARGTVVTRGYPLEARAGERVDHPHHVGLWFNYGDVNGIDFWNNSDAIKVEDKEHYGEIRHKKIKRAESGKERGELEVETEWVGPDGRTFLGEDTLFVFQAEAGLRSIDRITVLTAGSRAVRFNDNKEGLLGIRVARQLEQPSKSAEIFTDSSGKPTKVARLENKGVTGEYLSSEGKTGDAVWGTRGRWAMLSGRVGDEKVTLAILDHPANPGFPTYWHARGYGLFAANPLGRKVFSNGREELKFSLEPGQSATFRHRVLILSGDVTPERIESLYQRFIGEVK